MAGFEVKFPMRHAMLKVYEGEPKSIYPWQDVSVVADRTKNRKVAVYVPVLVWPMPTQDGRFIVEHKDGKCHTVYPYELTFLGSAKLFDQYDWSRT